MLDSISNIVRETWIVLLEASPWLVVGLLFAGLVRSYLPGDLLTRLIGKVGIGGVFKAALFGAPLPLCSCGVLPTAIGLRRQGLSRPATVSFLIATPQNGVDSLAISYSMLGLPFTIARLVCSLISAVLAGIVTWFVAADEPLPSAQEAEPASSCCCSSKQPAPSVPSCCASEPEPVSSCCSSEEESRTEPERRTSLFAGQRYAFGKLYSELSGWLLIGILIAGVINAFVSPSSLNGVGSNLLVMLLILLVSIPMYICATASTPVAASMLMAGISPGAVLVFLLAGPATNAAGIVLIRREIGSRATAAYLGGLIGSAVGLGLLLDALAGRMQLIPERVGDATGGMIVPHWLAVGSAMLLVGLFIWQRTAPWRSNPETGSPKTPPQGGPDSTVSLQSPAHAPQA
ncbi:MAG: SO_0444 family Cu/Zn efflux transporter [Phycisphaerales bacterium JB050]